MPTSKAIQTVVFSAFFYVCGWLCIFKTEMLVEWRRNNYSKSKLAQANPISGLVTKPWYPIFIQCCGVLIWLWALLIDYLAFVRRAG
jgi:hypothetical protein